MVLCPELKFRLAQAAGTLRVKARIRRNFHGARQVIITGHNQRFRKAKRIQDRLATLDETWQEARWGTDREAEQRRARGAADTALAERFLALLRP